MKKTLKGLTIFIAALSVVVFLTACSKAPGNTGSTGNTGTSTNTGTTINSSQTAITYTKEFSYLPALSNMTQQSYTPPGKQMGNAKYLIKDTTTEKVLNDYGDILKKDGWNYNYAYYSNKKPYSIAGQKDKHQVILIPQQSGNDVILSITSI